MSEFDSWLEAATSYEQTVDVCLDGKLVADLEQAESQLREASQGMLEPPADLEQRVQDLAKRVQVKTRSFTFRSIGRRAWRKLHSEHPPTESDRSQGADFNTETFPVAAMVASCVEPGLTPAQAEKLTAILPEGEFDRLWGAVLLANLVGADAKKAVATAATLASAKK